MTAEMQEATCANSAAGRETTPIQPSQSHLSLHGGTHCSLAVQFRQIGNHTNCTTEISSTHTHHGDFCLSGQTLVRFESNCGTKSPCTLRPVSPLGSCAGGHHKAVFPEMEVALPERRLVTFSPVTVFHVEPEFMSQSGLKTLPQSVIKRTSIQSEVGNNLGLVHGGHPTPLRKNLREYASPVSSNLDRNGATGRLSSSFFSISRILPKMSKSLP